ncbi:MAG: 2Fe-2S iron-sulfur cluster-binding protein [Hyphomonas sp.]|nr:2Fe-2S iron-sulfur cluster-binding protein [Hyphomonas sp.]
MRDSIEDADTVIIGTGMGAMTAARLLQDQRRDSIIMLEAHTTLGGMTHEFQRHGDGHQWSFASGLHYLGKTEDRFATANTIRYLTGDRIQWQDLPERYDVFDWGSGHIGIPAGHMRLEDELTRRFPTESPAIRRYLRRSLPAAARGLTIINIANSLPERLRSIARPLARMAGKLALKTTKDVMQAHFQSPELRAILAFQWGDYGQSPANTAFGFHATIAMHYAGGAIFPIGGPARIGTKTIDMIRQAGGDVRAGHRVTDIMVDDGRATGVRVHDKASNSSYLIEAANVVSGIGARRTAELLPEPLGPILQAELVTLGRNISCCILFLGLSTSPSTLGFDGANHWLFEGLDHEAAAGAMPGEGPLYVSFGSLKDPASRTHSLEVMALTDPAHFDRWAGDDDARNAPDYMAEKERIAARILERIEKRHPGFQELVLHQELATPLTFGTYQRAADGAFYGLPASPERMVNRLASPRWPVEGLYLAGQDAMTPGILGAAAGGVRAAGVMLGRDATPKLMASIAKSAGRKLRAGEPWNGFLKVAEIELESPTVKSFTLVSPDGAPMPFQWKPGQFLTLHAQLSPKTMLRSYTISSACGDAATSLRLTIKAQPDGRVSPWLHDELKEGDLIEVAGPFGACTFEPSDADQLVLIGGGVGVTPFASILDDLTKRRANTRVTALFGFRTQNDILFKEEMVRWCEALPNLDLHVIVSEPDEDWSGEHGRIDRALLLRLVPDIAQTRVHVCGPEGLMDAMFDLLPSLGVAKQAIHSEKFNESLSEAELAKGASVTVTFARQGRTAEGKVGQSLLDIAQAAGVDVPMVCGAGSCGACRMRVLAGAVKHPKGTALSATEEADGYILACQARPQSDLSVDA